MRASLALPFVLGSFLALSTFAQEAEQDRRPRQEPFQPLFSVSGIEFTADQQAKISELREEYVPQLTEFQRRRNTVYTAEQRRARRDAFQAARDAGLTEVMLLYTDRELTRAQEVAIQLSHNAIAGQDDLAILRELYDEINDVALKEYSGLDDVLLGRMEPPNLDPLSEKGLEYRIVSIAFLPDEVQRAEELFARILAQCTGDTAWLNRMADYDRFLDALTAAKTAAGVKNTATAFGLLLDAVEEHLAEPQPGNAS